MLWGERPAHIGFPAGKLDGRLGLLHCQLGARVPVAVEGVVVPAVTALPSPLSGVVAAGKTGTKRLIVQGKKPFRIIAAGCSDARFQCTVLKRTDSLYVVDVTFTAGDTPGKVKGTVRIETDLGGAALEVPVEIRVLPRGPVSF